MRGYLSPSTLFKEIGEELLGKFDVDKVGFRNDWERMKARISYGPEYRKRTRPIRSFLRIVWTHGRKLSYWTAK